MKTDRVLFKGDVNEMTLVNKETGSTIDMFEVNGRLYNTVDTALESIRINRQCAGCGELVGDKYTLYCSDCRKKRERKEWEELKVEAPTEMLFSRMLDSFFPFSELEDEVTDLPEGQTADDLLLQNCEVEPFQLMYTIVETVGSTLYSADIDPEVDYPKSLIDEIEKFEKTLPLIYRPKKSRPTSENVHKEYVKLSWQLLEYKCMYYNPELVHPDNRAKYTVKDAVYDSLEAKYKEICVKYGYKPTASEMVGFDKSKLSCQLVALKLGRTVL